MKADESAAQIRDRLRQGIDENDRLFVAKLTGETAWHNLMVPSETVRRFIEGT